MPKVEAKQLFEYAGRLRAPGEQFEVDDRFVALLVHVGHIHPPAILPADSSGTAYRTTSIASAPVLKDGKPAEKRTRNRERILGASRA